MKKPQIINLVSLIVCLFVFVSTLIVVIMGVSTGPEAAQPGAEDMTGLGYFKAFTVDSNVFAGLTTLIVGIYNLKNILQKRDEFPKWLVILQLVSATAVAVTMMTTILFLGPTTVMEGNNYFWLFSGTLFFLHFLNPLLVILIVMFILNKHHISWKESFFGVLPVFVYSLFYVPFIITGVWMDFYGFTFGGQMWAIPISIVVMLGVSYLFSFLISLVHNKFIKNNE